MKSSGMSTAISEIVSETMVSRSARAFERGFQRVFAFLNVADDVFNHDDRVVTTKPVEIVSAIKVRLFRL